MNKVIEHLSNAQMEISKAAYYSAGRMDSQDEFELRYFIEALKGMVERAKNREEKADARDTTYSKQDCLGRRRGF